MQGLIIDPQDEYLLKGNKWFIKSNGYVTAKLNNKFVLLHRLILKVKSWQEVDHINRNKLDNRRSNLRISDRYKQMRNATYKPGKSGIVGVIPHGNHWIARRRINGTRFHLGCFQSIKEAKEAYERAICNP